MSTIQIFIFKNVLQNKSTKTLSKKYFKPTSDKIIAPHTHSPGSTGSEL